MLGGRSSNADLVDAYGFELANLTPQERTARLTAERSAAERAVKWEKLQKRGSLPGGARLKRYMRKGVPPAFRSWAWYEVSGAAAKRKRYGADYFERMANLGLAMPAVHQIELDLPRTFPRNPYMGSPEGQAALKKVLVAHAAHNAALGYCQSMNFVAATLLLALNRDPERTFWVFVALLEDVLYPETYAADLRGCHVEMRSLEALLATKRPKLAAHLKGIGCDMSLLATDWYLCLFCTSLPSETAARVWDALLNEGAKILYRVALVLLQAHERVIMSSDNPGELLRLMKDAAARTHDRDALMTTAFNGVGSLPMARINELRAAAAKGVTNMLAERASNVRKTKLSEVIRNAQQFQEERHEQAFQEAVAEPASTSEAAPGSAAAAATAPGSAAAAAAAYKSAEEMAASAAASAKVAAASVREGLGKAYASLQTSLNQGRASPQPQHVAR